MPEQTSPDPSMHRERDSGLVIRKEITYRADEVPRPGEPDPRTVNVAYALGSRVDIAREHAAFNGGSSSEPQELTGPQYYAVGESGVRYYFDPMYDLALLDSRDGTDMQYVELKSDPPEVITVGGTLPVPGPDGRYEKSRALVLFAGTPRTPEQAQMEGRPAIHKTEKQKTENPILAVRPIAEHTHGHLVQTGQRSGS